MLATRRVLSSSKRVLTSIIRKGHDDHGPLMPPFARLRPPSQTVIYFIFYYYHYLIII